uniref:Uncharacterized protein n=1 Tax=viral metagenome TaxID=1070528 RepID=A0A6C0BHC9_9ZZZZ
MRYVFPINKYISEPYLFILNILILVVMFCISIFGVIYIIYALIQINKIGDPIKFPAKQETQETFNY